MPETNNGVIIANVREDNDLLFVCPELIGKRDPPFIVWDTIQIPPQITKDRKVPTQVHVLILRKSGGEMTSSPAAMIRAKELVIQAAVYAVEHLNARVIGLTSLTSSVTRAGEDLKEAVPATCAITHGDALASIVAREQIERLCRASGKPVQESTVAIIGNGLIGNYVAVKTARACKTMHVIGRNQYKLDRLVMQIHRESPGVKVLPSTNIRDAVTADVIVTATSSVHSLLTVDLLRERKEKPLIIVDVSVPPNVGLEAHQQITDEMPLVVRVDGSMIAIPNINMGRIKILGVRDGTTFACWGETIMQTGEKEQLDHVGPVDDEWAKTCFKWMDRYGFSIATPACFGSPIEDELFARLRVANQA